MRQFLRFLFKGVFLISLAFLSLLTLILLQGLCRRPFGIDGVSAFICHLLPEVMFDSVLQMKGITTFFIVYIATLYFTLLLRWITKRLSHV
jgi:hypothetical protein